MKNVTFFTRLLFLVVLLVGLVSGSASAQFCNLNSSNISVSVMNTCDGERPTVFVNFNSFNIEGDVVIEYQPVFAGFITTNINYQANVEAVNGFTSFQVEEPILVLNNQVNNFVRILSVSVTGGCTQMFTGNEVVSNNYSLQTPSDVTISNLTVTSPPCPNVPTGQIAFSFLPSTPNVGPFTNFNRFQVRGTPFDPNFFITLNPPNNPPNNTNRYRVTTNQGLVSGTYTFLINDLQTGCELPYVVSIGGMFDVDASATDATCFGVSDGTITITPQGANPQVNGPLTWAIAGPNYNATGVIQANGPNTYPSFTQTGLAAGSYTVFLTASSGGCTASETVFIGQPDEIVATVSAPTICADEDLFTVNISGVSGLDPDARFRFIDGSQLDNIPGNNNNCWTRPNNGTTLLATLSNGDGTYTFSSGTASAMLGCRDLNRDTTVTIALELRNTDTGCRNTFFFDLQIDAQPVAPAVDAIVVLSPGDTATGPFCAGQEIEVFVADYDPAFVYTVDFAGAVAGTNIDTLGDFAALPMTYTGPGTVAGNFINNNNSQRTIAFSITKTNPTTGCVSVDSVFTAVIRPLPVVDPNISLTPFVCSDEEYSISVSLNDNGSNANVRFNYQWSFNGNLQQNGSFSGFGLEDGDDITSTFRNVSGATQTVTLTITPTFPQNNPLAGGGNTDNSCEGTPVVVTLTVAPEPVLTYSLVIGSGPAMTLTSGDVQSFEICSGDDFLLNNLMIAEDGGNFRTKNVEVRINGDAGFLNIPVQSMDPQLVQTVAIENFTLGVEDVMNNNPDNNAQVAEIILTPYFESFATNFPECAGEPIRLFLTVNPEVPTLVSPQAVTVCSDERIEYRIGGASGMGDLETRITRVQVLSESGDFIVPPGAASVDSFAFTIAGADGGNATGTGAGDRFGGRGALVMGTLSDLELLPGDTVRVRLGQAGASKPTNGDGGDGTTLVVIRPSVGVVHTVVAAGGGGAGNASNGGSGVTFSFGGPAGNGTPGVGPGGFGGTGFPSALGGDGRSTGGGGGGGWVGGNGGASITGSGGLGGLSHQSGLSMNPTFTLKNSSETDGEARLFYTVVYDDIRFNLLSRTVDPSLIDNSEHLTNGEVDSILFGQRFFNPTNGPLDVTYVFSTNTEANCGDAGSVEVVVTVEPNPTGFLESGTTEILGNANNGYTANICSGDALEGFLNTVISPTSTVGSVYFLVSTSTSQGITFAPGNGQQANASSNFGGQNSGAFFPLRLFENGIINNTGATGTVTYTITPYIFRGSMLDACEGDPFTFTVTVEPGFDSANITTPSLVTLCSREALSDVGFDFAATQTGLNNPFNTIRIVDFRASTSSPDFTPIVLDTVGLASGGTLVFANEGYFNDNSFSNRTGSAVTVEYDVRLVSSEGCESEIITYPFRIRAEPIISESNAVLTVCSDDNLGISVVPAANSAFFATWNNTADVTFSYELTAPNLTYTGSNSYPASGANASLFSNDSFENLTNQPQTATYTVVATTRFGCTSLPATYTITVLPRPDISVVASQGNASVTGTVPVSNADTLTICSGSSVNFELAQSVTGTPVRYRIARDLSNAPGVTDGQGTPLDNFEGGLEVADFSEAIVNPGTASAFVRYTFIAYTFGTNGVDNNGGTDDCRGTASILFVEITPSNVDESALENVLRVDNGNGLNTEPSGTQVCDNSEIRVRPRTTLDPTSGLGFTWVRENDGTPLAGDTEGTGVFETTLNGSFYEAVGQDRIRQVLTATDETTQEVRYIVRLYSFGNDGINDFLAEGSDDCLGDVDTVTVLLDPTPVLTLDLEVGSQSATLNAAEGPYFYEICSGDDFLIDNLVVPESATGKVKYVSIVALGQIGFLGLPGILFADEAPATGFSLGAQNVQNTTMNNSAQTAIIAITPYFEDGSNTNNFSSDECAGEPIIITVTLNPTPTPLGPFSEVVCSDERVEYTIPDAMNVGQSRVAGGTDFSESNDFVVPIGAQAIRQVNLSLSGANGGGTISNNRGGLGGTVNADPLNPFFGPATLFPGDTVRVRKGIPGNFGISNGDGGSATLVYFIAGPNNPGTEGEIFQTYVAGGGGGAGFASTGGDTSGGSLDPNMPAPGTGTTGIGLGGFGGTGWLMGNPIAGSLGGAGRSNGGGGGGGWRGGNGGSNLDGAGGSAGTSFAGLSAGATFGTKSFGDSAEGEVQMTYTLVYNDIRFVLNNRNIAPGLVDNSDNPIVDGETDTILFGERFFNPTNGPLDVVYNFSTSSEANCPGSEVIVTLTIEPNPTVTLSSGGTTIVDNNDGTYSAEICSGDSLSAILNSLTIPTGGANAVRAQVVGVDRGPNITFGPSTGQQASGNAGNGGNFGGNNRPSVAPVAFFESSIVNVGTGPEQVTYTVVPFIANPGAPNCFGDTIQLTVTVNPEFVGVNQNPATLNLCSNTTLADGGFDLEGTQTITNMIAYDRVIIDTVVISPANNPNFETLASVYNGSPVIVNEALDYFGDDLYRNRTGGPVFVTYTVRLISGTDCFSEPIGYVFRFRAEPVILAVETLNNSIDTVICNNLTTGLVVNPAANSAFSNPGDFEANIDLSYEIDLPSGVTLTKVNGVYPNTDGGRFYMQDDELENTTDGPLDVVYTVTPLNNGCAGDAVTYTVTVEPNPAAELTLTSLDSEGIFNLDNSRQAINPNPIFGMCSGQALDVTVSAASVAAEGMLMARVVITDPDGLTGLMSPVNIPASELGDLLSFAAGEITNTTATPQSFTVNYFTWFEKNGTAGFQSGSDCRSEGNVEFDVVVSAVNTARVDVRVTNDAITTPIPSGLDTLCSGALFDLAVRTSSSIANDPDRPAIDSFIVQVNAPGLIAGPGTQSSEFTVGAPFENPAFYFTRLDDLSFVNTTAGIKTVTYIAIPYSSGCAGIPDTTTISFRPTTVLELNEPVICALPGTSTAIFAVDVNQQTLTTANADYRWRYIGGTASGFSLTRANGNNFVFVGDPANQANLISFNNERTLIVTPAQTVMPGTARFEILYDNLTNGACGAVLDTVTLTLSAEADSGTPDPTFPVQCDGVNIVLTDALLGESAGGVFTLAGGGAIPGSPNFTPMVGGNSTTPVEIELVYTVGGGNSGCSIESTPFSIFVEPAPNAGSYVGTPGEACQGAFAVNLYDLLTGATPGGTFTQTAGIDFVTVDSDGVFDQNGVTPGTYVYSYTVASAFGCGSEVTAGLTLIVRSQQDCSEPVPCDTIVLNAGFNVISFDVIPMDTRIESIFADEIATNNLLSVFSVNPATRSSETYTYNPVFGTTSNSIAGIVDGLGYIVQVANTTTIVTCGMVADTSIRAELVSGLNIVGYTKQGSESSLDYFSTLIAAGDLNQIRTVENGQLLRLRFNPLNGDFIFVKNSFGYLLDVASDYAPGSWRTDEQMPTSNFDMLFGYTNLGSEHAGQSIKFLDAVGNVLTKATVAENGTFENVILYGDLSHTRLLEGLMLGEEIFAEFQGEVIPTGLQFDGGWRLRQADLNFSLVKEDAVETISAEFSVSLYPNPTAGLTKADLNLDQDYDYVRLEVVSMLGQVVATYEYDQQAKGQQTKEIDLQLLPSGTYQVLVLTEQGVKATRQVIRR